MNIFFRDIHLLIEGATIHWDIRGAVCMETSVRIFHDIFVKYTFYCLSRAINLYFDTHNPSKRT